MWWKTAARRLEPWVPTSAEYRREQLRATASAAAAGNGLTVAAHAEPPEIHDAEVVGEPEAVADGTALPIESAADGADVTDQGTLPVEDPPEWPEAAKPGSGQPKGK